VDKVVNDINNADEYSFTDKEDPNTTYYRKDAIRKDDVIGIIRKGGVE
jgi:hypothetical protein